MTSRMYLLASALTVTCMGIGSAALAQSTAPTVTLPQSGVSVVVGNGVQQSVPVLSVPSQGTPLIGVGALSGSPDHYGSMLSLSALNTARLLGVDGPGGLGSALSISVPNPRNAPILSKGQ